MSDESTGSKDAEARNEDLQNGHLHTVLRSPPVIKVAYSTLGVIIESKADRTHIKEAQR